MSDFDKVFDDLSEDLIGEVYELRDAVLREQPDRIQIDEHLAKIDGCIGQIREKIDAAIPQARNLVSLDEGAQLLGVDVGELNRIRDESLRGSENQG